MPFGPSLLGLPRLSLSFFFHAVLTPSSRPHTLLNVHTTCGPAHYSLPRPLRSAVSLCCGSCGSKTGGEFHSDLLHCLCQMLSAQYHCCCTYVCNLCSSSLHRPCRISVVVAGAIRQHRVQEWPCWLFFRGALSSIEKLFTKLCMGVCILQALCYITNLSCLLYKALPSCSTRLKGTHRAAALYCIVAKQIPLHAQLRVVQTSACARFGQ